MFLDNFLKLQSYLRAIRSSNISFVAPVWTSKVGLTATLDAPRTGYKGFSHVSLYFLYMDQIFGKIFQIAVSPILETKTCTMDLIFEICRLQGYVTKLNDWILKIRPQNIFLAPRKISPPFLDRFSEEIPLPSFGQLQIWTSLLLPWTPL